MSTSPHVPGGQDTGKRLALVIGTNQTRSSILPALNHAIVDAQAMADVLEQHCHMTLFLPPLLGEQATSTSIKQAVLALARDRNADDLLLFYFSGHGQQAYDEVRKEIRNTYLGTADFNEQDAEDDPHMYVSMHWLREHLFEITNAGRVLIIIDCCYAEDIRTPPDYTLIELRRQLQRYFDIPGAEVNKRHPGLYVALAAAGYDKVAGEQEGHGTMTGFLLKALRGEVPALMDERGQITLGRLQEYIKVKMPDAQKPVISISDSTGQEFVLVEYPELAAQLRKPSRAVGAERPTSYLPFLRNSLFQPRPGEFEHLETLLLRPGAAQQPVRSALVGVIGMGGIGKTQLAVEFAYRYRDRFPAGIFWMPATGHTFFDWQHQFAELAFNADYLPIDDDVSHPENERKRARHLCQYLAQHPDTLLILDNVEEPDLVVSTLPALAGGDVLCAVLYTSRITSAPQEVTLHNVERLPEDAALNLLLKETRPRVWSEFSQGGASFEVTAARQACQRVGYLPLALVHLRGRLAQDRQVTLARLAEILQQGRLTSLKKILFEIFHWSWERVTDQESQQLFLLASYFPEASPIPLWLLGLATGLGESAESFEPLGEACQHLQAVTLVERLSGDQLRLHPLVCEFGQTLLLESSDQGKALAAAAINRLTSAFIDLNALEQRINRQGYWNCLEQVRAARDYATRLHAGQTMALTKLERWLDRESYLLADDAGWRKRLPGLLYQQLMNRAVEEGALFLTGKAPTAWLEQVNQVTAEDRSLIRIFAGHTDGVYSVAFSPDGRRALTGSDDNTARLWEVSSGRQLAVYEGHTYYVRSVAFSPDSERVLTGSLDKTARLWEVNSGKQLAIFEGHTGWVNSVAFSPDGKLALTDSNKTARLWEVNSGKQLAIFEGHTDIVDCTAFSPDGKQVLTGSRDKTVRLWDVSNGKQLAIFEVQADAIYINGSRVLTHSSDGTAWLWEISSGKQLATFKGHTQWVYGVAFSPDGKQVLTGSQDTTVRLWEVSSGKQLAMFDGHTDGVHSVAFSPDGRRALTGSQDNTARLWEVSGGKRVKMLEEPTGKILSVAFSPDGRQVLTGSQDKMARLWEVSSGKQLVVFKGHRGKVNSVAFSPDGKQVLTGSQDKMARLWEVSSGKQLAEFGRFHDEVSQVAFSPNGKQVLIGISGNDALLVELGSDKQIKLRLRRHPGHTADCMTFSPDGRLALIGFEDEGVAGLWETSNGKQIATFEEPAYFVSSVAFSPDGRLVLTGIDDGTAYLREISSGKLIASFGDYKQWSNVSNVAFSPDGALIATCDGDGRVQFWRFHKPGRVRLLGLYMASYAIGAMYWYEATSIVLADYGGTSGRPHFYHLKLHGMEYQTKIRGKRSRS